MKRVKSSSGCVEKWLIGIDEVGRGPLAGPVTVAVVATGYFEIFGSPTSTLFICAEVGLPKISRLGKIRDSKKLSPKQRDMWNKFIKQNFIYSVHSVSSRVIDEKGISYAARFAVSKCLKKILPKLSARGGSAFGGEIKNYKLEILLDGGLFAPPEYKNQQTIIKGDERVPIIAAASIIAKVHRDRYMTRLHKKYPVYGFDAHKGYGTKAHMEAIIKNGLSEMHRKSFCKNIPLYH